MVISDALTALVLLPGFRSPGVRCCTRAPQKRRGARWLHNRCRIGDSKMERGHKMPPTHRNTLAPQVSTFPFKKLGDWCAKLHFRWPMLTVLHLYFYWGASMVRLQCLH